METPREEETRRVGGTESHPRAPPSTHARVKHARFTHVLTDVPARIRHRTTRVSAILYDPRRPAYRCALHIHMTAWRGSARTLDAPLRHSGGVGGRACIIFRVL